MAYFGFKVSCAADGSKGPLTADALPVDFPFIGGLSMHSPAQTQPRRQEAVGGHRREQQVDEAAVGYQVCTHLHAQRLQGLLTYLQRHV